MSAYPGSGIGFTHSKASAVAHQDALQPNVNAENGNARHGKEPATSNGNTGAAFLGLNSGEEGAGSVRSYMGSDISGITNILNSKEQQSAFIMEYTDTASH